MAAKPPDAFLSYTRFDDRRGDISAFREHLEDAVREVTGESFEIFQDVEGIGIGEHWPDKLDEMLDEARFFIPILTPSYFNSAACRDELEKFLRAEKRAGRRDLVLPIYYIRCPVLEDKELREADDLASAIHQRQRREWRDLRHNSFRHRNVRLRIDALAQEIAKARQTRVPRRAAAATSSAERAAPAALTSERSTDLGRSTHVNLQDTLALPDHAVTSRPESLRPGTVFRDIDEPWCPELVVIPPGEFMMGSPEGEEDREEAEGPQHLVKIGYPLAVGRYPLTFEEYEHLARTTGRELPSDEGWGRGRRPVINVSWVDATAYTEWLSLEFVRPYRLLSEAEWEYACRAGSTTRYWWGDDISPEYANYGEEVGKTSEVGSYPANPWGLYDTHGNAWEWVEDCWITATRARRMTVAHGPAAIAATG
jgi:formylglycine-generating enzyme required for sulfatase activity